MRIGWFASAWIVTSVPRCADIRLAARDAVGQAGCNSDNDIERSMTIEGGICTSILYARCGNRRA